MELDRIDMLLEKYFEGETSIIEEKELKDYFSSSDVAQHLEQYKPLFGFFSKDKEQTSQRVIPLVSINQKKNHDLTRMAIAASVVILLGVVTFNYLNYNKQSEDLGSYDDPEVAFRETQKALALLSTNVNVGVESVQYIQEFEKSKSLIFKKQFKNN